MIFIIGKKRFKIRMPKIINVDKIKEVFKVDERKKEEAEFYMDMIESLFLAFIKTNPFVSEEKFLQKFADNWADEVERKGRERE